MKNKIASLFLVLSMIHLCGCAAIVIGASAGGLGAYAISKDTIQGETDRPYDVLWDAALKVAKIRGSIQQANYEGGIIESTADSSRVWVRVMRLTRTANRLRISARKYHFPNLDLAQELFVKIMEEAR